MKVSVILIDWNVRESFHSVEYLNKQDIERSSYELIWVEYFSRREPILEDYLREGKLDKYIVLGNETDYYHKHVAWNEGAYEAEGDILVLCDSDAIFKESFITSIRSFFMNNDNAYLHLDEIRNNNTDFWPFRYPSWQEVMNTSGLYNWDEEKKLTHGLALGYENMKTPNRLFYLNFGACLCVKKEHYIKFGGLDEHESYAGYVCGAYDLSLRMNINGVIEHWHHEEFLLHTYHPWVRLETDKMGPHCRYASILSFKHWYDGNVRPVVQNRRIRQLRSVNMDLEAKCEKPVFSVIVPGAIPKFVQRFYDSIENATDKPCEVIFISDKECDVDGKFARFKIVDKVSEKELVSVLDNISADIAVVVPPRAVMRRNSLDRINYVLQKNRYAAVFPYAIHILNNGFTWNIKSHTGYKDIDDLFIAIDMKKVPEDFSSDSLSHVLEKGIRDELTPDSSIYADIWDDVSECEKNSSKLEELLGRMLKVEAGVRYDGVDEIKLKEAKEVFDAICLVEKKSPSAFFEYCFMNRYSIVELHRFIAIFHTHGWNEVAKSGRELVVSSGLLLLNKIEKQYFDDLNDTKWLKNLLIEDIEYFIGTSYYYLGNYAFNNGDLEESKRYLISCIDYIPDHRNAKKLLLDMETSVERG